jgi:Protein of Unknown function (DUF2784)
MWYKAGADLVVIIHLLFIGFVVGGVFLAWRWPRIVWAHIPAVIYGALVEFAGFTCPLTLLENDLRRHPPGRMRAQRWLATTRHDHGTGPWR